MKFGILAGLTVTVGMASGQAFAQADDVSSIPFYTGAYVTPMASWLNTTKGDTKDGWGGVIGAGYREDRYAFEFQFTYASVSGEDHGDAKQTGGGLYGLYFPFRSVPNLYAIAGFGLVDVNNYPGEINDSDFGGRMLAGGLGHLWHIGGQSYDFGIRTEVLYRDLSAPDSARSRDGAPSHVNDVIVNVGLYLPLGRKEAAVADAPAAAVAVVPLAAAAAPADSDGDGVADADDHCPDTPAGTQVDAQGCPLPPPCKPPEAGQLADLSGCAVGTSIVLRGVNFEYDKARLTLNAKALLDGVATSLLAAPAVQVEIGGHTDSRGSDSYNQGLSERRAQSVMEYLSQHGVEASRMTAKGYGETQPVADNDSDEGRELNRRVELKIVGTGSPAAVAAPAADAAAPAEPAAVETPTPAQ